MAFSTAVELRIPSLRGLTSRVVALSLAVAGKLDLPESRRRDLESAAMLRDIGLCSIPYGMMNGRDEDAWSGAERLTYDRHPEIGAAMLEGIPSLRALAPLVRWHHAPFNADDFDSAAPAREGLPVEARILKVVSEYVWLERTRGDLLARESLRAGAGVAYDPFIVAILMEVLRSPRARQLRSLVKV